MISRQIVLSQAFAELGTQPSEALERRLVAIVAEAQAAWPSLHVEAQAFVRHLAARVPDDADVLTALDGVRAGELYLAFACIGHDEAALRVLETQYIARVQEFVARLAPTPAFVDELRQLLRDKLVVQGKLAGYAGRGSLAGFVRAAAFNTALKLKRRSPIAVASDADAVANSPAGGVDPEVAYLKSRYRDEFSTAVKSALATLTLKERAVLRLHVVGGLNIDKIGAIHRVHRATVARWLASSRERLLAEVQRRLGDRLGLSPAEVDSLAGLVRSQLDGSIVSALGPSQSD
jgi:RNA polymerase sigma-70 factor (ECF subfamily)